MQVEILTSYTCDHIGELGWGFNNVRKSPEYSSINYESRACAHDLIEHVNGLPKIGTIADELQACAGAWRTRGMWLDSPVSAEGIAGDIKEMARSVFIGSASLISRLEPVELDPLGLSIFQFCTIEDLYLMLEDETQYYDHTQLTEQWCKEYINTATYHFNVGLLKHVSKYEDSSWAYEMFKLVTHELKLPMELVEFEGEQIKLEYCFESGIVDVTSIEPEDYYDQFA